MTTGNVEQKVKGIIAEQLGVAEDEIKTTSSFIEDLGADSLDIVELVMAMEEEFEVEIPDEEAENIKTVGDAINYINMLYAAELRPELVADAPQMAIIGGFRKFTA